MIQLANQLDHKFGFYLKEYMYYHFQSKGVHVPVIRFAKTQFVGLNSTPNLIFSCLV